MFIYLFIYSFIYLCIYSFIHSFIYLFVYLFYHLFIHLFICFWFIYLCIYSWKAAHQSKSVSSGQFGAWQLEPDDADGSGNDEALSEPDPRQIAVLLAQEVAPRQREELEHEAGVVRGRVVDVRLHVNHMQRW